MAASPASPCSSNGTACPATPSFSWTTPFLPSPSVRKNAPGVTPLFGEAELD